MKNNIFEKRVNILPYKYPQLLDYKDAIRHSYWIDTEFNFTEDIQDFKVNLNDKERDIIKKTMLSSLFFSFFYFRFNTIYPGRNKEG